MHKRQHISLPVCLDLTQGKGKRGYNIRDENRTQIDEMGFIPGLRKESEIYIKFYSEVFFETAL